jgi:hypothetical protein
MTTGVLQFTKAARANWRFRWKDPLQKRRRKQAREKKASPSYAFPFIILSPSPSVALFNANSAQGGRRTFADVVPT